MRKYNLHYDPIVLSDGPSSWAFSLQKQSEVVSENVLGRNKQDVEKAALQYFF
jgi:hypothetical protein